MSIRVTHIGHRLLGAVGTVVICGLIAIILTYALRQEKLLMAETQAALTKTSESVELGLAALMITDHASAAYEFASRLSKVPNVIDYRILRVDGVEAFRDNETVDAVNARLGEEQFEPRGGTAERVLPAHQTELRQAVGAAERVFYYETLPGEERQVTVLSPILAQPTCVRCHGEGEQVRGVLKLTVSLHELDEDVERTWQMSMGLVLLALAAIASLVHWVAERTVVSRIVDVSSAMRSAAGGDLAVRLPADTEDEIGHMARSFNHMSDELVRIYAGLQKEKNKLDTIIQGADSGIVVTNSRREIVLVNRAAETFLGRSATEIAAAGFDQLFDDADWMQRRLASPQEHGTGLLQWRSRMLKVEVSTIRNAEGRVIGSAALIRDVTEEKRLEARLREQSITDALTGLFNRRHFDEVILAEYKRWQRYGTPLAVMMLDIDHFKRFNDTHGHECGDRVLIAIGGALRGMGSPSVVPCRYGGEEMVVVLLGQSLAEAAALAEEIRQRIAALVVDGLQVTASIGVAGVPVAAARSAEALVARADAALYRAKSTGRNCVVCDDGIAD